MVLVNMILLKNCITILHLKQKSFMVFVDQSVTTKPSSEIMINAVCNRVWPYKATMQL